MIEIGRNHSIQTPPSTPAPASEKKPRPLTKIALESLARFIFNPLASLERRFSARRIPSQKPAPAPSVPKEIASKIEAVKNQFLEERRNQWDPDRHDIPTARRLQRETFTEAMIEIYGDHLFKELVPSSSKHLFEKQFREGVQAAVADFSKEDKLTEHEKEQLQKYVDEKVEAFLRAQNERIKYISTEGKINPQKIYSRISEISANLNAHYKLPAAFAKFDKREGSSPEDLKMATRDLESILSKLHLPAFALRETFRETIPTKPFLEESRREESPSTEFIQTEDGSSETTTSEEPNLQFIRSIGRSPSREFIKIEDAPWEDEEDENYRCFDGFPLDRPPQKSETIAERRQKLRPEITELQALSYLLNQAQKQ